MNAQAAGPHTANVESSCSIVKVCCDYIQTSVIREHVESGAQSPFAYQGRGVSPPVQLQVEITFWEMQTR